MPHHTLILNEYWYLPSIMNREYPSDHHLQFRDDRTALERMFALSVNKIFYVKQEFRFISSYIQAAKSSKSRSFIILVRFGLKTWYLLYFKKLSYYCLPPIPFEIGEIELCLWSTIENWFPFENRVIAFFYYVINFILSSTPKNTGKTIFIFCQIGTIKK